MRIALIIQHYPPYLGGAERQACLYAHALTRRGTRVDVLTTRFHADLEAMTLTDGVKVRRLPTVEPRVLKLLVNLGVGFFAGLIIAGRVDVIHGHCLSPFVLGVLLGTKLRGRPVLIKVCSVGPAGDIAKIRGKPLGGLLWHMFRLADRFVAPTAAVVDELIAEGVASDRVSLVPNLLSAIAPDNGQHRRYKPHRPRDRLTLLYVGRLSPEKGLDRLMRVWPGISEDNEVQLVLVGDGPQRAEIERWRAAHALEPSVILAGYQADPTPYYQEADLFVFPSRSETFGNVIVEAMSHGLPVATTVVGVVKEWPDDAPVVRLDDTSDAAWLASLRGMIQDVDVRTELGARARAFVASRYTEEDVCRRYEQLYQQLLTPAISSIGS